jgi:serine/threonine-protein kinase
VTDALTRLAAALEGRYRIERELGEGGMATVYLAEDLKHDRRVALKVLKPELAAVVGGERFLAEIRTTANLQHPGILPLFDSGDADSFLYYVMPYVEGESLRGRLDREHQLPVDEAVKIATDVAEALDYAHEHGVVHRDVKPANILLVAGRPVLSDFGIALAVGAAGGGRLTETGLSLGTPHYMSPEQATGEAHVGPATDLYALGCVLYEMLTGDPPHTGSTAQAVLGKIITEPPASVREQRRSVPANVDAAIRRALEKVPADRFRSAGAFARALADPGFRHGAEAGAVGASSRWKRLAVGSIALAGVLAIVAGGLAWALLRPAAPAPVTRYALAFTPGQQPVDPERPSMALAPDGSSIVYVGPGVSSSGQRLWLKRRDQVEPTALAGTDGAVAPSFSPDGQWVLYLSPGGGGPQLRKIPIGGGTSIALADSTSGVSTGAAWLADGTIVYADSKWRLRRIPAGGGTADSVWAPPMGRYDISPRALPDSRGVLFTVCDFDCQHVQDIWALDLRSGKAHRVVSGAVLADYTSLGQLVYVRTDGSVLAAPFDLKSLETTGPAVPLLRGVKVDGGAFAKFALSRSGTLLMMSGAAGSSLDQFVWVTRTGAATPVDSSWTFDHGGESGQWTLSPDGQRFAAVIQTAAGENIWIKQLPHGPLSRLTFDSADDYWPHWSPDGRSVTFASTRPVHDTTRVRTWTKRADGVGEASLLYASSREPAQVSWSPDGKWLVLRTAGTPAARGGRSILLARPGDDTARALIKAGADYDVVDPQISPDSRWIAYVSSETGQENVFVRPFPDVNEGKWQISTDGGSGPLWAHSGRELFYVNANTDVVDVGVRTKPTFSPETGKVLFHLDPARYAIPNWCCQWDIAPGDQRFLMARLVGTGNSAVQQIILVQNWLQEVKAKVKVKD